MILLLLVLLASGLVASAQPMTLGGPSIVHPTRYTVIHPYATPTLYVKWDAAGTGSGLNWTDAMTTISAAITAAAGGGVIEVSGGTTGHTYSENLTISKVLTIQGSTQAGHNGLVVSDGLHTINTTADPCTNRNMMWSSSGAATALATFFATWNGIHCEDMIFAHTKSSTYLTEVTLRGTNFFDRCNFYDLQNTNNPINVPNNWKITTGGSDIMFRSCMFGYGCGSISAAVDNCKWTFLNCTFATLPGYASGSSGIQFLSTYTNWTTIVNNCVFLGGGISTAGAANTNNMVISNNFWRPSPIYPTTTNICGHVLAHPGAMTYPNLVKFQNATNSMGKVFVRIDDLANASAAWTSAQTLNPEVVVNFSIEQHGTFYPMSVATLGYVRNLVDAGNAVGCHSATHSNLNNTNTLDISATGTTPTVTISGIRAGDSTTWSGTMAVTINGTTVTQTLTPTNRLSSVISYWNGRAVGDGTVTCALHPLGASAQSVNMCALCLADVAAAPIGTTVVLLYDRPAICEVEVTEAIADLQAYIRTGSDRNGLNASGAGAAGVGTPSASYTVRYFVSPYGNGYGDVCNACIASGLLGGNAVSGESSSWNIFNNGGFPFSPWSFAFAQGLTDKQVYGMAYEAIMMPSWFCPLWHGAATYDDTLGGGATTAKLKSLLTTVKLGNETLDTALYWLSTNTDWTAHNVTNKIFTGDATKYLWTGDYRPTQWSLLRRAGTPVSTMADLNRIVTTGENPDIGAFKR